MSSAARGRCLPAAGLLALAFGVACTGLGSPRLPADPVAVGRPPRLFPDYAGCVMPPNIAPLRFVVRETGGEVRVRVWGSHGRALVVGGSSGEVAIPRAGWRELLAANRGGEVRFDVYVRSPGGPWRRFETVGNRVAPEPIDPYVVYRLIGPAHNLYHRMGTYQRHVESFDESPILVSGSGSNRCVNCHTFPGNRPDTFVQHMRDARGVAMLLARGDGSVERVDTRTGPDSSPAAYSSWHPSGRLLAFSVNRLSLLHRTGLESRDVFDADSDLRLYDVAAGRVLDAAPISQPDRLETFPAWSPDGRHLYYSAAPRAWSAETARGRTVPDGHEQVRYSLMRVAYDPGTGRWGSPETVLDAGVLGRSLTEPRPSPDGRLLLFTSADYGNFPIWRGSADLHLLDLETGEHWRSRANSERSDSWHSWSSNGRWIAFASKRLDGLFGRIWFSYVDADGRCEKPVLLPQEDPAFYDSCLTNFNAPELVTGRVAVDPGAFERVLEPATAGEPAGAAPSAWEPPSGTP